MKKIKTWFIYRTYKLFYNAPAPKFKIGDSVTLGDIVTDGYLNTNGYKIEGEIISMRYNKHDNMWLCVVKDNTPFENNHTTSMGYEFDIDFLTLTFQEDQLLPSKSYIRNKKLEELGI
jgi:hypothetical protein